MRKRRSVKRLNNIVAANRRKRKFSNMKKKISARHRIFVQVLSN